MDKVEQEFQYKSKTYRRQYMDTLMELYKTVDNANMDIGNSIKNIKDDINASKVNRRSRTS